MVAIAHEDNENLIRIYIKGAPEVIVPKCHEHLDKHGEKSGFDENEKHNVLVEIMQKKMTTLAMRPIAFSYVDVSIHEFNELKKSTQSFTSKDSIANIFHGQIFLGIVALRDPLREGVKQSIEFAKKGGVTVRLISGDNIDTAKAYAVDCGILSKEKL